MATVFDLAQEMAQAFVQKSKGDETIDVLRPDSPPWMHDVAYSAHGDHLPGDWTYTFIRDAVEAISQSDGDLDEAQNSLEADVYTVDLTKWLSSRLDRIAYLGDAISEGGFGGDGGKALARAQLLEREEVFESVVIELEKQVEIQSESVSI